MNEITQTKEGFIKSMILFIVLLGVCFAPFFAISRNQDGSNEVNSKTSTRIETGHIADVSMP